MQNVLMRTPDVFNLYTQNPNGSVSYSTQPSSSRFFSRTQSGYTGHRPAKPMPPNNYFFRVDDLTEFYHSFDHVQSGVHTWGYGPGLANSTQNGISFLPAFDDLDTVLRAQALDRLSDKVRGDLDVSVDLAEAHKTFKMLNASESLVSKARALSKRYGGLKTPANLWLEFTYGWKPLLKTLYGAADENLRTVINKTQSFTARASAKYIPDVVNVNTIWGGWTLPVIQSDLKRSWTYGVDVRTDQFDLARWSSLNPVSIAWELLPFSFVADWVFNVGGYLRNMETYLLYANKFRSGFRTRLTVGTFTGYQKRTSIPGFSFVDDTFLCKGRLVIIERAVLTNYPIPNLPSFKARLGSSRLLSAASLLAQLLSSSSPLAKLLYNASKASAKARYRRRVNNARKRTVGSSALPNKPEINWY